MLTQLTCLVPKALGIAAVAAMEAYAKVQGHETDFGEGRFHHQIHLSDVRRCQPERLKAVIRQLAKNVLVREDPILMEIRKLRDNDDFLSVSHVYEESWKAAYRGLLPQAYLDSLPAGQWIHYLERPGRESLILLDGGKIVGAAGCSASRTPELSGWGEINSLYLLPEYWGRGCGKLLFSAVMELLESMGYQNLFLWVLEGNQRARAFYQRMGFRPDATYQDVEIGGMPVREILHRRAAPSPSVP